MTDIKKFMDIVNGAGDEYSQDSKAVVFGLLLKTAEDMGKVIEMLKSRNGAIEPWLQSKISTASALVGDVHDFLAYSVGDYDNAADAAAAVPAVPSVPAVAEVPPVDPMAADVAPVDELPPAPGVPQDDFATDVVDADIADVAPVEELPPLPGDENEFVPESVEVDEDFLFKKKPAVSKERMNQVTTPRSEKPEATEWGGKGFFSFRDFEKASQDKKKFSKK